MATFPAITVLQAVSIIVTSTSRHCLILIVWLSSILLVGCSQGGSGSSANAPPSTGGNSSSTSGSASQPQTPSPDTPTPPPAPTEDNNQFRAASVNLSWSIPTQRADGAALGIQEIAGYELVYINSEGEATVVTVADSMTTSHEFLNLTPDNYLFVVFAYDTNNTVSTPSEPILLQQSDFPLSRS